MSPTAEPDNKIAAFVTKMEDAGLNPTVINTFARYYRRVVSGETGLIFDKEIRPVSQSEIEEAGALEAYSETGARALSKAIMIKLNGGLGTSMGLTGPKSLLTIKNGKTFLEIIVRQTERAGAKLALMNSFSTHASTLSALENLKEYRSPILFLQHKYPKILQKELAPVDWPANPDMEWNPPGHGDIYTALFSSGMLKKLLDEGITHAFISNSDNLGASMDPSILGYFVEKELPFMMEVAERTPADTKGGHLAIHKDGHFILREVAQCPGEELRAFMDISLFKYFNTNNIWINLAFLHNFFKQHGTLDLTMILNPKTLDPRDAQSPPVYQIESAMGSAISLFKGATAIRVPKSRLIPVKTCNDLLIVRSDYYLLSQEDRLFVNPKRRSDRIKIDLDPTYFRKIDGFDERFVEGVPSLVDCESLTVRGNIYFEKHVSLKGAVRITSSGPDRAVVGENSVVDGNLNLSS